MDDKKADYYDYANMGLLGIIPDDAAVVLEIGCGAGRLGMEYKKKNPSCAYHGVEIHPPSAAVAATRLDKAICGAAEDVDLGYLAGTVDCLVYGDVLEHLIDPWGTLKAQAALLRPGGKVVACIPNVQHWSVVEGLLQGNWTYTADGLLDRTHLRFFTLSSIIAMFQGADLAIQGLAAIVLHDNALDPQKRTAFFTAVDSLLGAIGSDRDKFHEQSKVFQYLVTASRG